MSSGGSSDLLVDEAVGADCWSKFTRRWPAVSGKEKVFIADRSKAAQAEEKERFDIYDLADPIDVRKKKRDCSR
jgi:hypothetical protein